MALGWAYIDCSGSSGGGSGGASGPIYSVQFMTASGTGISSGSTYFTYNHTSNNLVLSGNLTVTGTISASVFQYRDITVIDATGSTFFGDTSDDSHIRTGSLVVTTDVSNTTPILSASTTTKAVHIQGLNVLYEYIPPTSSLTAIYTASQPSYIIGVRSTGSVELEIPSAINYKSGAILLIKDEVGHTNGTNIKLSAATDTYTIENDHYYILTGSNPAISLYSNGANWFVF